METEAQFLVRLQSKSSKDKAFTDLLSQYKERLYWHIRNMVTSHEDTDDVLQNTFIKVFNNIDNFKGNSKLYTWMYRIATNEALTFLSNRAKQLQISSEELQQRMVSNLTSDPYFEGDEMQLKLQKAIAQLPQKQQMVFRMRYFQEMKYSDMSEILDTSEGALKASYHIAVKKIEEFVLNN
ncbi:RNA polymerase sigma factor [Aegicerativicinus sediminis]|uniref:RNA polymerase sigma factor n=1 Tax=Aegicerativicinus sediminis TaxID=2893202 RepID=UPI001E32CCC4|nr:RNA polymerase sigma factor [Aegicerativicinus sediminis]